MHLCLEMLKSMSNADYVHIPYQGAGPALTDFIAGNPWLTLKHHVGADALQAIYAEVVAGQVQPDEGHIVRPS